MADMDIINIKKIYWEKVGEVLEGKTLIIKIDSQTLYNKTVPAGKYFNGRIQLIGELINNEDRPADAE